MRAWRVRPTAVPPSLGLPMPSDRVTPIFTRAHASLTHLLRTRLCVGPRGGQGLCRSPSTLSCTLCWPTCLFLNNWDEGGGGAEQALGLSPPFPVWLHVPVAASTLQTVSRGTGQPPVRALSLISLSLAFSRVGQAEEGDAGSQASGDTGLKALTPLSTAAPHTAEGLASGEGGFG